MEKVLYSLSVYFLIIISTSHRDCTRTTLYNHILLILYIRMKTRDLIKTSVQMLFLPKGSTTCRVLLYRHDYIYVYIAMKSAQIYKIAYVYTENKTIGSGSHRL